jgi:hemerythrin-like metal-binding protein
MAKVEWDDSLSVNVDLIDEQHKMLIQRLSDLHEAVGAHKGPNEIVRTLNFLSEYTEFHFGTEETHMKANDYPEMAEHMKLHDEFRGTITSLGEDFEEEGATASLADSIEILLVNWLLKHIRGTDVRFGQFLREKGIVLVGEA